MYKRWKKLERYFRQVGSQCQYCRSPIRLPNRGTHDHGPDVASFDHIVPRSRWVGPIHARSGHGNLALVCFCCNNLKDDMTMNEFLRACLIVGVLLESRGSSPAGGGS